MNKALSLITIVLFSLSFFSYFYIDKFSMGHVEPLTINDRDEADNKLLIISQQSAYKDALTQKIIERLKNENVHIELVELTSVDPKYAADFDAIIIMHTWEVNKPPKEVENLLREMPEKPVFTISTSGSGDNIIEGVDGFSSASVITNIEADADKAVAWFNEIKGNPNEGY